MKPDPAPAPKPRDWERILGKEEHQRRLREGDDIDLDAVEDDRPPKPDDDN